MFIPRLREWFSNMVSFRSPEKGALRMLLLSGATAAALMLMAGLAEAGLGEICYSPSVLFSQDTPLTNATTFTCPSLGVVTIPQIYQLGWRVTQMSQLAVGGDPNNPAATQVAWMILIETP
jgi:hypothetical protein